MLGLYPVTIDQRLACWISRIEIGRRDATDYTMPVPSEWLANGCRPFQLAYLHDRIALIDQPTIDIVRQGESNVSVEFSFLGLFLGLAASLPDPLPPLPRLALTGLSVRSQESIFVSVGVAIAPITFVASGGNTPYAWSSSALPSGLSLNAGGVLSGIPTIAGTTTVVVTVTDASAATATTSFSVNVVGVVVPDPGFVSVYSIVNSARSGGKCVLGVRGSGLNVRSSALSSGRVTDVTPPIINLRSSAISSGSVS